MEILLIVVVVVVLLVLIGKLKGSPSTQTMETAHIVQRLSLEQSWISRYQRLPLEKQRSPSLAKMFETKTAYVRELQTELASRATVNAVSAELTPIMEDIDARRSTGEAPGNAVKAALDSYASNVPYAAPSSPPTQSFAPRELFRRDSRTEEEKREEFRLGLQRRREQSAREARNLDVEAVTADVLAYLAEGCSVEEALGSSWWAFISSNGPCDALVADIDKRRREGMSDSDAIRSVLTKYAQGT